MSEGYEVPSIKSKESFISAFSAGVFLILVGTIFVATPGLFDKVVDFFGNFEIAQVPNIPGIFLPVPIRPANYTMIYSAAVQFSLAWGVFLIGLLAVRIFARSSLRKKAENASDIVFWLVAGFVITSFLNRETTAVFRPTFIVTWFAFWATIITLIGISLIIRAVVLAAFR